MFLYVSDQIGNKHKSCLTHVTELLHEQLVCPLFFSIWFCSHVENTPKPCCKQKHGVVHSLLAAAPFHILWTKLCTIFSDVTIAWFIIGINQPEHDSAINIDTGFSTFYAFWTSWWFGIISTRLQTSRTTINKRHSWVLQLDMPGHRTMFWKDWYCWATTLLGFNQEWQWS